jgi:hypothetical protein
MRIIILSSIVLTVLTRAAWAQGVQSTSLPTPTIVAVKVNPAQKATTAQITRYLEKTRLLEEHDIPVQTLAAPIPFSSRLSANKLTTIKPRAQALFSDGINVKDQVDATKLAGMDYHYVSTVAEPSAAVAGEKILITFNWGAVWSTDKGKTFQQLDPYALFEQPQSVVGKGFCCDQLVLYDKTHDLVVWLLQGSDAGSGNTIRLLFAKSVDLTPGQSLQWHVHDFTPESIGAWKGEWFDFPDMATTNQNLFVSFNSFSSADDPPEYRRSVVLRFSLSELSAYAATKVDIHQDDCKCAFSPRLTQGGTDGIYWATHEDTGTLLVRGWLDVASTPTGTQRISVEPYQIPAGGGDGPNGKPWLSRLDDRITAGWASDGKIGFAWTSGPIGDGSGIARYPLPHIRVAIINTLDIGTSGSVHLSDAAQPHIWSSTYALAYPTAAPSKNKDIGIALYFGGRTKFPSAAVGFLRMEGTEWKSTLTVAVEGRNTPRCLEATGINDACGKWGDYLAIRSDPNGSNGWYIVVATERDNDPKQQTQIAVSFVPFHSTPTQPLVLSQPGQN